MNPSLYRELEVKNVAENLSGKIMNYFYKSKIRHHFNKAHKTYDAHCMVQNDASQRTLELLAQHSSHFKRIADFACGTGESTLRLIKQIQYERCYAIDFSEKLLGMAINKLPETVSCIVSDFDEPLFIDNFLDLIFCNMGLQWSLAVGKTLSILNGYLKEEGYFAFSMPVAGNFPEIKKEFKPLLLSCDSIACILRRNGFNITHHYCYKNIQLFESHYHALKSLKAIGANASLCFNNKGLKKEGLNAVFSDNCITPQLTYCIGIYLCQKPSL